MLNKDSLLSASRKVFNVQYTVYVINTESSFEPSLRYCYGISGLSKSDLETCEFDSLIHI